MGECSDEVHGALKKNDVAVAAYVPEGGLQVSRNFPLLTLVPLRGFWGEGNSWTTHRGRTVEALFEIAGFSTYYIDDAAEVATGRPRRHGIEQEKAACPTSSPIVSTRLSMWLWSVSDSPAARPPSRPTITAPRSC